MQPEFECTSSAIRISAVAELWLLADCADFSKLHVSSAIRQPHCVASSAAQQHENKMRPISFTDSHLLLSI